MAGASVSETADAVTVRKGAALRAIRADVSDIPDLAPALAALLLHAEGTSILENAGRLRLKESDRLAGACAMVNALGGCAEVRGDSLVITGVKDAPGGHVDGMQDHRMVMAAVVAASACRGPSRITDTEAVQKSYPGFFRDISRLGGNANGIDVRE